MYEAYKQFLSALRSKGRYRKLSLPSQENQKNYLDFSTNDYLCLSRNPEILNACMAAGKTYGVGATGSRLLSGNNKSFDFLEARIAKDKNTEAALVFNTGFQANVSVLAALLDSKILGAKPIVFFDKLNHASLYQAIFITNPQLVRYAHNDMKRLASLLEQYKNDNRPKFIVTETVFGMDGDMLPIQTIVDLAREHKALLYLDEAHATGIFGPYGYGLSTTVDLSEIPTVIMGTFSKALGCSGGYIACDQILKEYLINKAQGFIYSTANSPMVIGSVCKAWDMVKDLSKQRHELLSLSVILKNQLSILGFDIGTSASHIIPIILRTEETAMKAKEELLQNGIIVACIRPPAVSQNASRIRIALNCSHTKQDIQLLLETLKITLKKP